MASISNCELVYNTPTLTPEINTSRRPLALSHTFPFPTHCHTLRIAIVAHHHHSRSHSVPTHCSHPSVTPTLRCSSAQQRHAGSAPVPTTCTHPPEQATHLPGNNNTHIQRHTTHPPASYGLDAPHPTRRNHPSLTVQTTPTLPTTAPTTLQQVKINTDPQQRIQAPLAPTFQVNLLLTPPSHYTCPYTTTIHICLYCRTQQNTQRTSRSTLKPAPPKFSSASTLHSSLHRYHTVQEQAPNYSTTQSTASRTTPLHRKRTPSPGGSTHFSPNSHCHLPAHDLNYSDTGASTPHPTPPYGACTQAPRGQAAQHLHTAKLDSQARTNPAKLHTQAPDPGFRSVPSNLGTCCPTHPAQVHHRV